MTDRSEVSAELTSVGDYLRWAASRFAAAELVYGHGTDNAWDEAVALIASTLGLPWDRLQFVVGARLLPAEREQLIERVEQRVSERLPLPYITGEAWFAGLPFQVDPRVLIPRSPIAELIEQGFEPWLRREPRTVADVCCGCGCIGIAIAAHFPGARVDLFDISEAALEVARGNVLRHGLSDRVRPVRADLLGEAAGRYDLIVANPPYVTDREMAELPPEYRHEPQLALAGGVDGLELVRRILETSRQHLHREGILVLEAGNAAERLAECYPELPFIWPEFERGGHGVLVLRGADLLLQGGSRAGGL